MGLWKHIQKKWGGQRGAVSEEDTLREKFARVGAASKPEQTLAAVPSGATKERARLGSSAYRVILAPVVTEKSARLASERQYAFRVAMGATKGDMIRAVRAQYGVTPMKVARIQKRGQRVRFGKVRGVTKQWVKMIVTLPRGKTLDVYGT